MTAQHFPKSVKIHACGSYVPEKLISTTDLLEEAKIEHYGVDKLFVQNVVGVDTVSRAENLETPSDLAARAAFHALMNSCVPSKEIDAVIYCGIESDYSEPATAHVVASKLGINANICFDLTNACHGFTSGMQVAEAMIKAGQARFILVCTAEVASKVTNRVIRECQKGNLSTSKIKKLLGAFTVGDGAGAMIIGESETRETGIQKILCRSISDHYKLCHYKSIDDAADGAMDMGRICYESLKLVKSMYDELLDQVNWEQTEIDVAITHQVGRRPYEKTLDILGIEKTQSVNTYQHYGNLASATIPVNYHLAKQRLDLESCRKLLIVTMGSGISVSGTCISM